MKGKKQGLIVNLKDYLLTKMCKYSVLAYECIYPIIERCFILDEDG